MTPQRRFRIAWFGHASGRRADGLSSYTHDMVRSLSTRGSEVLLFTHRIDGDRVPAGHSVQLRATRFKTVTIPLPGTRRRIARALDTFRPDVVHVSLSHSLLDPWILEHALAVGVPSVVTVHLPYAPVASTRGRVLFGLYRYHHRALVAAQRCIALSHDQRDLLLAAGCRGERIDVLANGVDTAAITPGRSRLREGLGAAFVVTYLGRVDPEKRVAALVHAFLERGWPDDHVLLIAGSGSRDAQVRRMVRGHPQVRLLGAVHDRQECIDILRATDVFVLPSTAEGLSLSLLEAMAAGCAVIATDVGEDGAALGDAGALIPVHPLQPALGGELSRLRDDATVRTRLAQRARERAKALYSLGSRVDAVLRLYAELCAGVAPAGAAAGAVDPAAVSAAIAYGSAVQHEPGSYLT